MLAVLTREPLAYEIARQKGSHRHLRSRNGYPRLLFAAHDSATLPRGLVREILIKQVGLAEDEAHAILKGDA
jgi:predicted RNA binding protein YcfA (HicA-like mRNA interferase family)